MIIDNEYIAKRIEYFILKQQELFRINKTHNDKLYNIKLLVPKWFRKIIFHPFNPIYSMYVQYKAKSRQSINNSSVGLEAMQPFAVNFVQYCLNNNFSFNLTDYYPDSDIDIVLSYIDNRLKSVLKGYTKIELNDNQKNMFTQREKLKSQVDKITNEKYKLSLDGYEYYLPVPVFEEHTYIHDYGLKYLPQYVIDCIQDKDFMDVGAYLGDTSILLLKKYKPKHLYAYEPVEQNIKNLQEAIALNSANGKITIVAKGISNKEGVMDMYINPNHLSGSSTNVATITQFDDTIVKNTICLTTIDVECENKSIGLLKMDIEGAEYSAIEGGIKTIKRDKPVLLISMYHTGKDFFEIPVLLKNIVPDYIFRFIDLEVLSPFNEKILIAYPSLENN